MDIMTFKDALNESNEPFWCFQFIMLSRLLLVLAVIVATPKGMYTGTNEPPGHCCGR